MIKLDDEKNVHFRLAKPGVLSYVLILLVGAFFFAYFSYWTGLYSYQITSLVADELEADFAVTKEVRFYRNLSLGGAIGYICMAGAVLLVVTSLLHIYCLCKKYAYFGWLRTMFLCLLSIAVLPMIMLAQLFFQDFSLSFVDETRQMLSYFGSRHNIYFMGIILALSLRLSLILLTCCLFREVVFAEPLWICNQDGLLFELKYWSILWGARFTPWGDICEVTLSQITRGVESKKILAIHTRDGIYQHSFRMEDEVSIVSRLRSHCRPGVVKESCELLEYPITSRPNVVDDAPKAEYSLTYKNAASKMLLFILAIASPIWILWAFACLVYLGYEAICRKQFDLTSLPFVLSIFSLCSLATYVCLQNELIIGPEGIKFPLHCIFQTRFSRFKPWAALSNVTFVDESFIPALASRFPTAVYLRYENDVVPIKLSGFSKSELGDFLHAMKIYSPGLPIFPLLEQVSFNLVETENCAAKHYKSLVQALVSLPKFCVPFRLRKSVMKGYPRSKQR